MLPRIFEKSHREYVRQGFEDFAIERGFKRKRKDFFVRRAEDNIVHGFWAYEWIDKYRRMNISPAFIVCHREIGDVIHNLIYSRNSPEATKRGQQMRDWITIGVLKFVIADEKGVGASADYIVEHPMSIDPIMADIFVDADSIMDRYFRRQSTLPLLIEFYENEPGKGGTAHWVKLIAMLCVAEEWEKLKYWIDHLQRAEIAPITQWAVDLGIDKLRESH